MEPVESAGKYVKGSKRGIPQSVKRAGKRVNSKTCGKLSAGKHETGEKPVKICKHAVNVGEDVASDSHERW